MSVTHGYICGDTQIWLDLQIAELAASRGGREWLEALIRKQWPNAAARPNIGPGGDQRLTVVLPIAEFPCVGTPRPNGRSKTYALPRGVQCFTYMSDGEAVGAAKVASFSVTSARKCLSIFTDRKRIVDLADNAELLVFDDVAGRLVRRAAVNSVGCLIPYVRREPILGKGFSRDLGWFYGALVSDGWLEPSMIGYAKLDDSKRTELVRIAKSISPEFSVHEYFDNGQSPGKYAASAKVHLFGRQLRDRVFDCYCGRGDGRGALYKRLPRELLDCGSRECLLGLIAGVLEGDSSLGWNRVKKRPRAVCRTNTSSWCFVKDLRRLGRLLSVRSSVTVTPPKGNSRESYVVCWSLPDIYEILPELRFVSEPACRWQADFLRAPPRCDRINIAPVTRNLAKQLGRALLKRGEKDLYGNCHRAVTSCSMNRDAANQVLQLTASEFSRNAAWQRFCEVVHNEAICWDRVRQVCHLGEQAMYGLRVPATGAVMLEDGLIVADAKT
jgi:hypothetical protein